MKGFLALTLISACLSLPAFANGGPISTGTARVDEANLEELKKDKKVLDRQEQQSTDAIHEKQREKYKVPGASEKKNSPIFRPIQNSDN